MLKKFISIFLLFLLSSITNSVFAYNLSQVPSINEKEIISNASQLSAKALHSAIQGYQWALKNGYVKNPDVLTIIDFTKPSNQKRAWLIDLKKSKVLMNFYTTHGKNSGLNYASSFSNSVHSNKTSLGVYTTLNAYYGKHGLSERLMGLENGVNNNALRRTVVIHPADYATEEYVKTHGYTGRSWGCFGISPKESTQYVKYTQNGSVIFAYADEERKDPLFS
ncbi:MAG: murein L,D-transpeptidase catalytic domain family protein [Legionellales bacterium]|nr:murein L,D-transpeptidase catalytic domain family protein [Legionellales bacterium]